MMHLRQAFFMPDILFAGAGEGQTRQAAHDYVAATCSEDGCGPET